MSPKLIVQRLISIWCNVCWFDFLRDERSPSVDFSQSYITVEPAHIRMESASDTAHYLSAARLNRMPDRTPCFAFSLWSHLQLLSRRHSAMNTQLVSTHRCSDIKYMIRIDLFGSKKQTSSSARYLNELTNRQDALVIITQCHLLPRDDWELTGSVLNTRWCVIPYFCLWSCSIK